MQTSIPDTGRLSATLSLPGMFMRWYVTEMPRRIVAAYRAYASAFLEVFAFAFLLKTLFSPWKNITDAYPTKGLNLNQIAQTFTLNCTARAIGFVMRIATIFAGLVVELLCLVFFCAVFALWVLYPLLVVPAVFYLLASLF
jgi:hypothetical protein